MEQIRIRRMSECTLEQAITAWNTGFENYFVNVTMTLDAFMARMAQEQLSPALSVVAFDEDRPVGILLNGIRVIGGSKVAWNGGTAVSPAYRRTGVGKMLLDAAIAVYREEGVTLATLEAILANEPAIGLYKRMGYETQNRVVVLQHKGGYTEPLAGTEALYTATAVRPQQTVGLGFHSALTPWQTQWPSLSGGEALIVRDTSGRPAAYCLFKRGFDAAGVHMSTTLYQCAAHPDRDDRDVLLRFAAAHVFASEREIARRAFNLPVDHAAMPLLQSCGFEIVTEQVYMTKRIS